MDCKSGDVLVNSNYRQGGGFYFSENGLSKVFHDFFFPHIPMYFVFPASVTDGVFLSKLFMFMDILCLPSNKMLGKTIHHMSLVFLWVPLLKQFSVCRRKEGSVDSHWSFFVFLIFFLFMVACLVAVAVSCSARATLWRLQKRRPSRALVSVLSAGRHVLDLEGNEQRERSIAPCWPECIGWYQHAERSARVSESSAVREADPAAAAECIGQSRWAESVQRN